MKHRARYTVFDFVLLAFFLLCAAGIGFRIAGLRGFFTTDRRETATLVADAGNVAPETADCIFVGDRLYTAAGEYFGAVAAVEVAPTRLTLESNGAFYTADAEGGEVSVILRVTVSGVWNGNVFLRDGKYAVLPGESLTLYTKKACLGLRILSANLP